MACGTCPPEVVSVLRTKVRAELNKLRAVLRLTNFINDAFGEIAGTVFEDLNSAVAGIPSPTPTTILDLLAYATCPLTPLALGISEVAELIESDVNTQLKRAQSFQKGTIDKSRRSYEAILSNSIHAKLIKQVRKYDRALRQLDFNAVSFAEAVVATAVVQSVCDDEEFDDVFNDYATLADGFSFSGGVPGDLDQNVAAVLSKISQGELKFKALRTSLYSDGVL